MYQTTIFDIMYPKYKIAKPIRLIELFAGYGSQYLALKYLGANVKHYKICEWTTKSIQAYNDLHIQDYFDYSGDLSDDNILKALVKLGVSINYNEPATREQLKRQNFRKIYNNIIATNNLVNIQNAKGEDFKIVNKEQYDYIMTYSFPCQDLSLAGKGKGMVDTSTRSGMLWEVERILNELKTTNSLPQILLMENVPQVHGSDNVEHFNKWQLALENMGYKNYFQDLIATDYGIPQTRNRCFMISILGDYSYTFPKPIPLELKLKDLLEKEVDEKYYLSEKMIKYMMSESSGGLSRKEMFERNFKKDKDTASTITTCAGNRPSDNYVGTYQYSKSDKFMNGKDRLQLGKDTSDTLQTSPKEGIVINPLKDKTPYGWHFEQNCYDENGCARTLKASEGSGNIPKVVTKCGIVQKDMIKNINKYAKHQQDLIQCSNGLCRTIPAGTHGSTPHLLKTVIDYQPLRIRKLTPLECFRLMGVKDEDYYKIAKNQSNSSLYHLAGDSIVVNVLMAIFKELIK